MATIIGESELRSASLIYWRDISSDMSASTAGRDKVRSS